jgi:hypothetical protein
MRQHIKRLLLAALVICLLPVAAQAAPEKARPASATAITKYVGVRYAAKERKLSVGPLIHRTGVRYKWCSESGDRCHWAKRPANARDIATKITRHRVQIRAFNAARRAQRGGAGGILAAIRACESGGDYGAATGNGFYGAYQFTVGTWHAYGGSGMPHTASPGEQDRVAMRLYRAVGTHTSASWPNCP